MKSSPVQDFHTKKYFLDMIQDVRHNETVTLHACILQVAGDEAADTVLFLEREYANESLDYPHTAPPFDDEAALWGATVLYIATQLLLYREHSDDDISRLFPPMPQPDTASAILSADLCLRFIPEIVVQLKLIDPEDKLITILEQYLQAWCYSGIARIEEFPAGQFDTIKGNACLHQLFIDRLSEHNRADLTQDNNVRESVTASLGDMAGELWPDLLKNIPS